MQYITFDFLGQHRHGTAFHQYLSLRKRFLVNVLDWNIPHNDDVEMDQYDNPCAHYALVLRGATVIGGARVMPTTSTWGSHSYMLRDARRGQIPIPAGLMPDDIATDEVWECTRLVISEDPTTQGERSDCLSMLLSGAIELVQAHGGQELISLSPVAMDPRCAGSVSRPAGPATPTAKPTGASYAMLRAPSWSDAPAQGRWRPRISERSRLRCRERRMTARSQAGRGAAATAGRAAGDRCARDWR